MNTLKLTTEEIKIIKLLLEEKASFLKRKDIGNPKQLEAIVNKLNSTVTLRPQ